jgi:hypothetical protein
MYENVTGMVRTRTISTVGRVLTDSNRPNRVYHSQVQTGAVAPGNYELDQVGLGFSLNPLNWIKSAVGAVKGVLSNSTVTLPTSQGNVTVQGRDLGSMIRGSSVSVAGAGQTPTAFDQFNEGVERIPGGWLTVAAVGAAGVLLAMGLSRRR